MPATQISGVREGVGEGRLDGRLEGRELGAGAGARAGPGEPAGPGAPRGPGDPTGTRITIVVGLMRGEPALGRAGRGDAGALALGDELGDGIGLFGFEPPCSPIASEKITTAASAPPAIPSRRPTHDGAAATG